jgi:YHS domain-containing protein
MRILVVLVLILVLYYLVRGLLRPRREGRSSRTTRSDAGGTRDSELVKDPYCQTYVPIKTALQTKIGGATFFFCSEECMNRYLQEKGRGI